MAKAQCDKNCFACPYEDCICDDLTYEDYKAEREIDLLTGAKEYKTSPNERARKKRYYEENKERIAATRREKRANNKEKISAYRREYSRKNKEKISAYQRKYREENKEKVAAAQRKYYEENIDDLKAYKRAWYQSNKERLRIKRQEQRRERRSGRL